jgi:hypothetical protein
LVRLHTLHSQFTSREFTNVLISAEVRISMDGKGRWMDNVFIERLWRTVKYECVYLHEFATGRDARATLGDWFEDYNSDRPHSSFGGMVPNEVYAAILLPDSVELRGDVKGNIADNRRFLGTVSDELCVAHSRPSPETGLCLRPGSTADEGERIAA